MVLLETARISSREFFKFVCTDCELRTGTRLDIRELASAAAKGEVLNPVMLELVDEVHRDCTTALLTNNVAEAGWRATFPFDLFDMVIDSSQLGVSSNRAQPMRERRKSRSVSVRWSKR